VQLQIAEGDPGVLLERRQVRLLMRIFQWPAGGGLGQPAQAPVHAVWRQILDDAVVLVPSAVLADPGNVEVAHGPQPRGEVVHDPDVTGRHPLCNGRPESPGGPDSLPGQTPCPGLPAPALIASTLSALPRLLGSFAEQIVTVKLTGNAEYWFGGKTRSQCAIMGWHTDAL